MDLDALRWLLTEAGQRLLVEADEATRQQPDPLRAQAALRRTASPEHVAAALTQVELRRRATEKFGELAARMYFTPEGLEQSTRLPRRRAPGRPRARRLRVHADRPRLRHRR